VNLISHACPPAQPTQFHLPPHTHHAHYALTLPPTAPACRHPRLEDDCSSVLGGGCHPRPRSKEDADHRRWPTRAQRRTAHTRRRPSVATTGAPMLRGGPIALACHRPAHTAAACLSSPNASQAARSPPLHSHQVTAPLRPS
jgi:hypothetical protein